MIKLNLGCWKRNFGKEWVHVDQAKFDHIDFNTSIESLPMFDDNSVDLVYSSHSLEYFDMDSALVALKEWHRVLKPGGVLRVSVPDFSKLAYIYWKTGDILLGPLFGKMDIDGKLIYHKTVFDFKTLSSLLSTAGFVDISPYDWKQTEHAQYDDHSRAHYPHDQKTIDSGYFRDDQIAISLNLEAIKQ